MGDWTIADVAALMAIAALVAVLTWAAQARAKAHRWNRAGAQWWRIDVIRAARHVRRIRGAAFGGMA